MPNLSITIGELESIIEKSLETNDFIVEEGMADGWTYEKRNSGVIKLWRLVTCLYKGSNYLEGNASLPFENLSNLIGFTTINMSSYSSGSTANNKTAKVYFSETGVAVFVHDKGTSFSSGNTESVALEVIGKWK